MTIEKYFEFLVAEKFIGYIVLAICVAICLLVYFSLIVKTIINDLKLKKIRKKQNKD